MPPKKTSAEKKTTAPKAPSKAKTVEKSIAKPKTTKAADVKKAPAAPAKPVAEAPKGPRVEIIKKADVLKRQAEQQAREAALKEAAEKDTIAREAALKEVTRREEEPAPAVRKTQAEVSPSTAAVAPPISAPVRPSQAAAQSPPPRAQTGGPPARRPMPAPGSPPAPPKPGGSPAFKRGKPPRAAARDRQAERERERERIALSKVTLNETQVQEIDENAPLRKIQVSFPLTLGDLAPKIEKSSNELIKILMQKGMMMTINARLDEETAKKIALMFRFELDMVDPLELQSKEEEQVVEDPAKLKPRAPVVTVMGHVDHGKTSLLDAIRSTEVAAGEFGGITQRIGAYQVELKGRKITFLDTPGHEAFTAMRARGTKITDVAVLVVAADDGVMPQTLEAIDHAKAASVPIVVAINKIDKANANPDKTKQQLSDHGLIPEEWGGATVFVPVSAKQKTGIEELLEMILLVADLADLKANPDKHARGTIIEGKLDRGKGPVATVLVQEGTFRIGDAFVAGNTYGRVRAFINDHGARIESALPSSPVEIIGLNAVPEAGDVLQVVADDKIARSIADARVLHTREQTLASLKRVTLDDLYQQIKEGGIRDLNLILKADGQGSVEALKDALERLTTHEIRVRVIHTGVGTITESDVMLASASNAIIIGYNIRPLPHIKNLAEREKVDIRLYRVIYQAIEDITNAMVGMRKPVEKESVIGRAEVLQTFKISKVGVIAGCRVTDGKITREANVRVVRDGTVVYEGKISSLKRFKDDAREVAAGYECGIGIEKFNDVKVKDVFEAYVIEEIKHTTLAGAVADKK